MKIIVDANILFSALIKDSKTREIILRSGFEFYTPEFVFEELNKYRKEIMLKSDLNKEDFQKLFVSIFRVIKVLPDEDLVEFTAEAKRLAERIDTKDVQYVAAVLKIENSVFWSDDKGLKKIKEIKILNSFEVASFFGKLQESLSNSSVYFFP